MIVFGFGSCSAPNISEALVLIVLVTIIEEDLVLPERVQRSQGLVLEVKVEAAELVQGLDSGEVGDGRLVGDRVPEHVSLTYRST